MNYPIFAIFGVLPSLVWLAFYLRQDDHPEPKQQIVRVFLWGMLATIPALFAELGAKGVLGVFPLSHESSLVLLVFLGIAPAEEILKFLVVRFNVYSNKELDEPVDLMMYMIISALGFSSLENIYVLFGLGSASHLGDIAALAFVRLLGATFLHALSSALIGYFLALSFAKAQKRLMIAGFGFFLAILLHGFFDFTIIEGQGWLRVLGPLVIFVITLVFISFAIAKLKQMKSVCIL